MLKRLIASVLTVLAVGVALTVAQASPAAADDLRYAAGPKRVVVNQSYENISWRIAGGGGYVDYANATLEHVATREEADFDYSDASPPSGEFRFYDWNRYGKYEVYGEVYDYDFYEMYAAPAYVWVKRAARSPLTVRRAGAYVTLRTVTKKYDGGYPRWRNHRNATVRFQRLTNGSWRTIARRTVPSNGVSQYRYRRPREAAYRVVVVETGTVWGKQSGTVRR